MKKITLLLALITMSFSVATAQFQVNTGQTPLQMVNSFILTGVSASNILYTGNLNAIGSFVGGNSTNLGLSDGIILSTGAVNGLPPINSPNNEFANTNNDTVGDALLSSLVAPWLTYDAAVLEFDLIPVGNILEFEYVFASEEYPEFVGTSFNDVFGFFINGVNPVGGNYVNENIAIIPGTTLPVCINNVNAGSNATYFVSNSGSTIIFDGFTTQLLAQVSVVPGTTYHLKMAIADAGDYVFDSGIFLKAQSMKSYMVTDVAENDHSPFTIYPNPLNSDSKIQFQLQHPGLAKVRICDMSGRQVYFTEKDCAEGGLQQISLDNLANITSGVFIITLETPEYTTTQRLVK